MTTNHMKKITLILSLLCIVNLYSQIQISNFTYNTIENSGPQQLQEFNGKIVFRSATDNFGRELWASEGELESTNMVKDIEPGVDDGVKSFFSSVLNNDLYFSAKDELDYTGGEIWKTDGTEAGTVMVTTYSGRLFGLTTVGSQIYMVIKPDDTGFEIWKTDGTESGTILVTDNLPFGDIPSFQGSINDIFIFTVRQPSTNESEVWRSDGTLEGTYALTDLLDGNASADNNTSDLSQYIVFNNDLYFVTRTHLYKTDGTLANTVQVAPVWNGQNDLVQFSDVIELNGKMYLLFFSKYLYKLSIYESDGTLAGTSEIFTTTSSGYFYPSYLNTSGDNLVFSSVNTNGGTSLFYMNTINQEVSEIMQIDENPDEPSVFWGRYSALSLDRLNADYFYVSSPTVGWLQRKGWIFNEATSVLEPVEALDNLYHTVGQKVVYNNVLYYSKEHQLWKYDTSSLSVNEFVSDKGIQVYPNPSSEFIHFSQPEGISAVKIYDVQGRIVLETPRLIASKIDVSNLVSGTYFIEFHHDNLKMVKKIVVTH